MEMEMSGIGSLVAAKPTVAAAVQTAATTAAATTAAARTVAVTAQ